MSINTKFSQVTAANKDSLDFSEVYRIAELVALGGSPNVAKKLFSGVYKSTINAARNQKSKSRTKVFNLKPAPRQGVAGWMTETLEGELAVNTIIQMYLNYSENYRQNRPLSAEEIVDIAAVYCIKYGIDGREVIGFNHVYNALRYFLKVNDGDEKEEIDDDNCLALYKCHCGSQYFSYTSNEQYKKKCPWCRTHRKSKQAIPKKDQIKPTRFSSFQHMVNLDQYKTYVPQSVGIIL